MQDLSYEKALAELQDIVGELQQQTVSIDDLSEKVKRANELIQYCKAKLRATEEVLGDLSKGLEQ